VPLYIYQNFSVFISENLFRRPDLFFEELLLFLKADGKDKVSVVACKFFYSFLFTLVAQSFYFIGCKSLQSAAIVAKHKILLTHPFDKNCY